VSIFIGLFGRTSATENRHEIDSGTSKHGNIYFLIDTSPIFCKFIGSKTDIRTPFEYVPEFSPGKLVMDIFGNRNSMRIRKNQWH
jgi:hypothetical protein